MIEPAVSSVTVVGLGVMGGSVAQAVLERLPRVPVYGIDPDPECAAMAAGDGVEVLARLGDARVGGGVVVFAAPLDATVGLVGETAGTWGRAALAMDVASLKRPVLAAAANPKSSAGGGAPGRGVFVGAHPMCGSQRSGYAAARTDLFDGADIWICPLEPARHGPAPAARDGDRIESAGAVERAAAFWTALGGTPRIISAAEHDRMMAWASHLPQLLASALAEVLRVQGITPGQLGPGGRDMTRLAGSSPVMWRPLLEAAAEDDTAALRAVERELAAIRRTIEGGDWAALEELMDWGRRWTAERD